MNLIIRLLIASIVALFKPKIRVDGATRYEARTWPWDYDIQGHMTNTRFLALADLANFQFMVRGGVASYFYRNKLLPVILVRDVKYQRMLTFPRKYVIHTRMAYWEEEYFCWHQVFEEGGKFAAEMYTLGVVLKKGTREKVHPAQIAYDLLQEEIEAPAPDETIINLMRRARERPELSDALHYFEG